MKTISFDYKSIKLNKRTLLKGSSEMQINVHAINPSYSQSKQQHSWLGTRAKKGTSILMKLPIFQDELAAPDPSVEELSLSESARKKMLNDLDMIK